MNKIAIFCSGEGDAARRLATLFNEGNKIKVELILTDRANSPLLEEECVGSETMFVEREKWHEPGDEILSLLQSREVDFLVLDDFRGMLPDEVAGAYAGRIIIATKPEEAPREVVAAIMTQPSVHEENESETEHPEDMPEIPEIPVEKSVDEEWAEVLQMNFDASKVAATPPPVPQDRAPINNGNYINGKFSQGQQTWKGYHPSNGQPMPPNHLVWAIIMAVCCCTIPAIVAIIYSSMVSSRYAQGDLEGAWKASKTSEIWIIVSFVLGVLFATLYLPIMLIS